MDMDVAGLGADRALVGTECRVDEGQVGLGSAHQEVDIHILPAALGLDVPGGVHAVVVGAIAGGLLQIGLHHALQDALMAALGVIACKVYHFLTSSDISSPIIMAQTPFVNGISARRRNRLYRQEVEP